MRATERNRRLAMAAVAVLAMFHAPTGAAEGELDKVREMLRIDTARALAAERARQAPVARPAPAQARRGDQVVLTSLYGLKGALNAIVQVNGEPRLYRQGDELPRGATDAAGEYRLQRIDDGCVYLRKGASVRSACILPSAPGAMAAAGPPSVAPMPAMPPMFVPPLGGRP
ncbi:MAG: hypothetical protein ABS43_16735 [Bordetella sp. SCN 67-23]|mgnify:CR=1 FL=1|nr:hypothetical protein [Burkholderiales bacterium]ODS72684.1 MAG: hypothetical protein ABS43_16735 [Bordetella sp. SCN 67-23]ODU77014.1 MAG: hypothetical protein ABT00_14535 [Bordetella sp. SCN 68-11]OJW88766.1 MAG: hypothetical protein BGO71_04925 [Burkholderiales bacterium 67-32]